MTSVVYMVMVVVSWVNVSVYYCYTCYDNGPQSHFQCSNIENNSLAYAEQHKLCRCTMCTLDMLQVVVLKHY